MRVAQVVRSDAFAGVERYIAMVAPRLAARGCRVTIVGGDPARMRAACPGLLWLPASTTAETIRQLTRLSRLDVVHAHMTAAELAAVVTQPLHRARLVATIHFASLRGSTPLRLPLRLIGARMDQQIAISEYVASVAPVDRTLVNGVESAEPGPVRRERSVLVVQRLEPEKQTDLALRAWASATLRRDGWRLKIAGRGTEHLGLVRLSEDLGIADTVDWLGFVDDVGDHLAHAGMLLAPAPAEPFGFSVVEAMARATPVLAANGGAHPETLGPEGWTFRPGDERACADLLEDASRRDLTAYGASLRSRQRRLFDIEDHTDSLVSIYRELVA